MIHDDWTSGSKWLDTSQHVIDAGIGGQMKMSCAQIAGDTGDCADCHAGYADMASQFGWRDEFVELVCAFGKQMHDVLGTDNRMAP